SEALPLALAVTAGDSPYKRVQPTTRALAALVVGQLGGAEHVDRVEPLLDDASTCFGPQMQIQGQLAGAVQVRDVGLVVLLQLTDQRPADYGYVNARLVQPSKTYRL